MIKVLTALTLMSITSLSTQSCKGKLASAKNNAPVFSQKDDETIQFGEDDVFRVGDGSPRVLSSCASEGKEYDLKGSTYYFQFEVIQNDTKIDLSIDSICGVDKPDASFISILNEDSDITALAEITVPTDAALNFTKSYAAFKALSLNKGTYSIVIRSKNSVGRVGPVPEGLDEFDDFVVGKLNLSGDKQLKAVKVYAE